MTHYDIYATISGSEALYTPPSGGLRAGDPARKEGASMHPRVSVVLFVLAVVTSLLAGCAGGGNDFTPATDPETVGNYQVTAFQPGETDTYSMISPGQAFTLLVTGEYYEIRPSGGVEWSRYQNTEVSFYRQTHEGESEESLWTPYYPEVLPTGDNGDPWYKIADQGAYLVRVRFDLDGHEFEATGTFWVSWARSG